MKAVLQRVREAWVSVDGREIARIGKGLLVLVGVEKGDTEAAAVQLAGKVALLRIFEDDQGKMNLSVQAVGGELLVVSQFTLAADLAKGTRPSFDPAEEPEKARRLIHHFTQQLQAAGLPVREGQFAARMEVGLINDGPVTFLLVVPTVSKHTKSYISS